MLSNLVGKTLIKIENLGNELRFHTSDAEVYMMLHNQDCCEDVYIEDIVGDLDDLLNSPILYAEERTNHDSDYEGDGSAMWTFYEFATNKGSVTIRWYGTSNGYYSVGVDFIQL